MGAVFEIIEMEYNGDIYDMIAKIPEGKGIRYYDKYIYRKEGKVYACYADNMDNFWEI
jgi:hypothetical protein